MNSGSIALVWVMMAIIGLAIGIVYGIVPIYVSQLFPTYLRYSGSSASYAVAAGVIGGLSPLAAVALRDAAGSYWPVAVYVVGISLLSCVAFVVGASRRTALRREGQLPLTQSR